MGGLKFSQVSKTLANGLIVFKRRRRWINNYTNKLSGLVSFSPCRGRHGYSMVIHLSLALIYLDRSIGPPALLSCVDDHVRNPVCGIAVAGRHAWRPFPFSEDGHREILCRRAGRCAAPPLLRKQASVLSQKYQYRDELVLTDIFEEDGIYK